MALNENNRQHSTFRGTLRILGPIIIIVGIVFAGIAFVDFFSAAGSSGFQNPDKFWMFFIALPLLFVGIVISNFGYMGTVARYRAREIAPVAKDTVNYMFDGTKDSAKDFAGAVREGITGGNEKMEPMVRCHKCNSENPLNAKFCNNCGAALSKSKKCPVCDELNDHDSKFCDNCGHKFI